MILRILEEAQAEISEASRWYDRRRSGLGEDFLRELSSSLREIEAHPSRFPKLRSRKARHCRRRHVRRYPFSIIYNVRIDEILVIAVVHGHRRPGYWYGRG